MIEIRFTLTLDEADAITSLLTAMREAGEPDEPDEPEVHDPTGPAPEPDAVAHRIYALHDVAPSLSQRQIARIGGTSQSKVSRSLRAR